MSVEYVEITVRQTLGHKLTMKDFMAESFLDPDLINSTGD